MKSDIKKDEVTVSDILKSKCDLKIALLDAIRKFEDRTGLWVVELDMARPQTISGGYGEPVINTKIDFMN